ncbi:hypothetical protein GCM10022216_26670 [Sphingobacterium kyonggiense]|uniref:LTXXQ motif family protein n=1 Tax=Sphingobacterium kyonggiense TaxID=714075 RepID=A0ABP7YZI5_9SPHI
MKKLILSAAILCAVVTFSNAQDRPQREGTRNPEEMAKRMVERLDQELKLSPAQKDSILKWNQASAVKQQAIFQDEKESREAKMEKMKTLRQEQQTKIKSILTDEQKVKYEEMSKRTPERGQRRQKN